MFCPGPQTAPAIFATSRLLAAEDYPRTRLQFQARRLEPQNDLNRAFSIVS
jgi:hypothetical protein